MTAPSEDVLRRSRAAAGRAARARKRQQLVVREYAEAFQADDLADQPIVPPWLALLLGSIVLGLLYLAWHAPG